MGGTAPGGTIDAGSEANRPSSHYSRPLAEGPSWGTDSGRYPIRSTRVPGDGQVHFWVVGRDGRARRGEYTPESGVRELPEVVQ